MGFVEPVIGRRPAGSTEPTGYRLRELVHTRTRVHDAITAFAGPSPLTTRPFNKGDGNAQRTRSAQFPPDRLPHGGGHHHGHNLWPSGGVDAPVMMGWLAR